MLSEIANSKKFEHLTAAQRNPAVTKERIVKTFASARVKRGVNAGKPLGGETLRRYAGAFWSVYKDIGDQIYNTPILEAYLIENRDNDHTRKACAVAICHFMETFEGGDQWKAMKAKVQTLAEMLCHLCNDASAKEESMATKRGMIGKYRFIPYKDLLLTLAAGAEKKADFRSMQSKLAFVLFAANEPLRCDYKNVVIADRCATLPLKTPYYKDGVVIFPITSTVKVPNKESLVLDVREFQPVIDEFIGKHSSHMLFGREMDPIIFAQLMLDESESQLGDRLGIRFFRTKYSSDNGDVLQKAAKIYKGMNNTPAAQERYYVVI